MKVQMEFFGGQRLYGSYYEVLSRATLVFIITCHLSGKLPFLLTQHPAAGAQVPRRLEPVVV